MILELGGHLSSTRSNISSLDAFFKAQMLTDFLDSTNQSEVGIFFVAIVYLNLRAIMTYYNAFSLCVSMCAHLNVCVCHRF